jgi:hypothetical protein
MSFFDEITEQANAVTRQLFRLAVVIIVIGIVLTIGAVMVNSPHGPVLLFCAVVLALLMALFGVALTLFKVVQIRLPELLIVVAVLGNAIGWGYSVLLPRFEGQPSGRAALAFAVALPCFVWTLGGAAWGLWVAKELLVEHPRQRLWLVTVGLLTPPAFVFAVAAVPFFAGAAGKLNAALCVLYAVLFILCLGVLIYAMSIHTRVLKEIRESGQDEDD